MSINYSHEWLGYEKATYSLSYKELKESWQMLCMEKDEVFLDDLPKALHLACVICWLKEIPTEICLCDQGIIHELVHLMHFKEDKAATKQTLKHVRKLFKTQLKLS